MRSLCMSMPNTSQSVVARMRVGQVVADEAVDAENQDIFHSSSHSMTVLKPERALAEAAVERRGVAQLGAELELQNLQCAVVTQRVERHRRDQHSNGAPAAAAASASGVATAAERRMRSGTPSAR